MFGIFDTNDNKNDLRKKFDCVKEAKLYPIGIVAKKCTGSFFGKAIKFFQNNEYIHVEFLLSDKQTTFGSRPAKGVNFYNIADDYLDAINGNVDIFGFYENKQVYEFTKEQQNKFYIMVNNIIEKNEIRYDAIGVLSVLFRKLSQDANSYYCSELVYDLMNFMEFPLLNEIPKLQNNIIYPSSICSSIRLNLISKENSDYYFMR